MRTKAGSREQGAGSREQGAGSREQGAGTFIAAVYSLLITHYFSHTLIPNPSL
jgi:hypothetical protein